MKKKNKVGDLRFPDFKIYYRATVVKTVWFYHKDRLINQRNRKESPETNCHIWNQIIFDKNVKIILDKGKGQDFQQRVLEKWDIHMLGEKWNPYLTPYTKNNSEWVKDLNVKPKTTQLLEENMKGKIHDIDFGNGFMNMTPKA